MENEMLKEILKEVKGIKTEFSEFKSEVRNKFEEIDAKFADLNMKIEDLNERFEKHLIEFKNLNERFEKHLIEFKNLNERFEKHLNEFEEFKLQFKLHDEGVKNAWENFENIIGEEFKKVHNRLDKMAVKIKFLEMGMEQLYLMHNKHFSLLEETEKYELGTHHE